MPSEFTLNAETVFGAPVVSGEALSLVYTNRFCAHALIEMLSITLTSHRLFVFIIAVHSCSILVLKNGTGWTRAEALGWGTLGIYPPPARLAPSGFACRSEGVLLYRARQRMPRSEFGEGVRKRTVNYESGQRVSEAGRKA